MRKEFKLDETLDKNFKKLEKVLPRIMSRMNMKTYGVIPSSIVHSFNEVVGEDGLIFAGCMFAGELQKVAFRIREIEGKETPAYKCIISTMGESHIYKFSTKKKGHVYEIESQMQDGDFVEIFQTNSEEVTIKGVYLSVLLQLNQKDNKVKDFVIDKFMGEEYERI